MRRILMLVTLCMLLSGTTLLLAQQRHDTGYVAEYTNEFWDSIKTESKRFAKKAEEPKEVFKMDFTGMDLPESKDQFKSYWHNPPISQGWSGMCWCFSATSFFESEVYRLTGQKLKFSEIYTVYWEYVEKARRYVQQRGDSEFGEGSEINAIPDIWKKYGIVPETAYTGLKPGQKFHDHHKIFKEIESYLHSVKKMNAWNEEVVLGTVRTILNHYLGEPPLKFEVDGKQMTPKEYFKNVVRLNFDDYVDFMSLKEKPYFTKALYDVPDNWWRSKDYYNVPLDDFMEIVRQSIRNGYTMAIGGDVSEPGYDSHKEVAMVPTFDIPSDYIDENARQYRFSAGVTTDDHAIHLVGYTEKDGADWYLIKDSGSGARNGNNPGYYFYHEDYVKLKIMNIFVHKDAVKDILKQFKN